ncbi:MAG: hypothetical protein J6U21_16320 [Bacteroidales bacterium]|nr:hypothetical protein [Bacteroidales bacterium]
MKKILFLIAIITGFIASTSNRAEAATTATPPPFAFKIMDVKDLHIDYEAKFEATQSYTVDYNQILKPIDLKKTCVPGRIPTFPFVAVISAIGTYTLYGAGAGPVTAAIIYIATDGNRKHTRQAIWGCVTGMVIGGVVKWLSVR